MPKIEIELTDGDLINLRLYCLEKDVDMQDLVLGLIREEMHR
jgi:hypothetical protein